MEIFHDLNGVTYILSVGFLGLWFLFSSRPKWNVVMGIFFFLCLIANFGITMGFTLGPTKYFIFSKNILLIALFGFVFQWVRHNKIGLIVAIIGSVLVSLQLFEMKIAQRVVPQNVRDSIEHGELLIETTPENIDPIRNVLKDYSGRLEKAFYPQQKGTTLDNFYIIDIPNDQSERKIDLLEGLRKNQLIHYGELNDVIQVHPTEGNATHNKASSVSVNDPLVSKQWAASVLQFNDWYKLLIDHREEASQAVKVAVLDTGVDGSHEDLKNMVDDGYQDMKDPVGHGTHCAGIIAAETNNNTGVSSPAFYNNIIRIMPVKVLNRMGFGTQAQIIKGMIKAVDNGAGVLSMSLGGISDEPKQKAYLSVVQYAHDHNAVVVTSAGNSSSSARGFSPANVPGVICVTALNDKNQLAYFSNYLDGIEWGIAAPGENIMSTYPGDQYRSLSGTSMSAPFVSSVAAMMKAFDPALSPNDVYQILNDTSIPTGDIIKSGGLIQPAEALKYVLSQSEQGEW